MKIKSIELNNIGLYKNRKIEFNSDKKSTNIIWGNNGAGKTTLLNSIKTGLFGSKAFSKGYEDYCKFIRENLISSRIQNKKIKASIKIELELKIDGNLEDYLLVRSWVISDELFEENINVFVNDEKLDFVSRERILNKISIMLPTSLLDVIIFDGENAINILNNDEMPKLMKNIVYAVFGMDVYSNLIKDLNLYLKNMSNDEEASEEQMTLIELEKNYKQSYLQFTSLSNSAKELDKRRKSIISNISLYVKKLSDRTGVAFDDIVAFRENLSNMEEKKKDMDDEIKFINEEILPLKLIHNKLIDVIKIIELEKPFLILKNIEVIQKFFGEDQEVKEYLDTLKNRVSNDTTIKIKYNLKDAEIDYLEKLDKQLALYSKEKLLGYYSDKNDAVNVLKSQIEKNGKLEDEESKALLQKIEDEYAVLSTVTADLKTINNSLDENAVVLENDKSAYEQMKKDLLAKKKASNTYLNVIAYRDALDDFVSTNIEDVCKKLNDSIYYELRRIKFRNGSIEKVTILPKSFEIKLYEKGNKLIPSKLFSAGEKQLLLGLVIKESINLSKVDTFFLFDTPVGRLDVNNRSVFTKEVIMKVSEQVFVFATDSDYSRDDYDAIRDSITSEMTLTRDSTDSIVALNKSIYGGK